MENGIKRAEAFLWGVLGALLVVIVVFMFADDVGQSSPDQQPKPDTITTVETVTEVDTVVDTVPVESLCIDVASAADSAHNYLPNRKHHDAFHRGIDRLERILHQHCDDNERGS